MFTTVCPSELHETERNHKLTVEGKNSKSKPKINSNFLEQIAESQQKKILKTLNKNLGQKFIPYFLYGLPGFLFGFFICIDP
jgi:hypothetical protein